jgi:hypothetical protein
MCLHDRTDDGQAQSDTGPVGPGRVRADESLEQPGEQIRVDAGCPRNPRGGSMRAWIQREIGGGRGQFTHHARPGIPRRTRQRIPPWLAAPRWSAARGRRRRPARRPHANHSPISVIEHRRSSTHLHRRGGRVLLAGPSPRHLGPTARSIGVGKIAFDDPAHPGVFAHSAALAWSSSAASGAGRTVTPSSQGASPRSAMASTGRASRSERPADYARRTNSSRSTSSGPSSR